jgi:DNA-binding IclR family transcriptional regulator
MGRERNRLQAAAAAGARLTARCDRRFRLPDALDAVLATPVLTPKALARQLALSPQAATLLLATLAETGVIREITGRSSFRAFAV